MSNTVTPAILPADIQILSALNRGPCGRRGLCKECPNFSDRALQVLLDVRFVEWRLVEKRNPDGGSCYYLTAAGLQYLESHGDGGLAA